MHPFTNYVEFSLVIISILGENHHRAQMRHIFPKFGSKYLSQILSSLILNLFGQFNYFVLLLDKCKHSSILKI